MPVQWMKEQTNRQMQKETNKKTYKNTENYQRNTQKPYLNSGLKLDLCRDQEKHVAGAVDVLVVGGEEGGGGATDAPILNAADKAESEN